MQRDKKEDILFKTFLLNSFLVALYSEINVQNLYFDNYC